jgi:hypothetical protein
MQGTELYEHEEQENNDGAAGIQEVLPALPQASAASGNEVVH